ncbi:2-oxo-hept-4-ene-1,7-dioate hydratase [Sphingobium xenophagum]
MIDDVQIAAAARALYEAEVSRIPIPPLSASFEDMDEAAAYRIQKAWIDLKLADGREVRGHKIGLTSRAMQRMAGWSEPDYGVLLSDMFYDDGAEIPVDRFISPMLECELAFILGKPLKGPNVSITDVLAATDYVVPALEIVDLRTTPVDTKTGKKRTVLDNISDNAANAAVVLGGRPVRPDAVDLRWIAAICRRGQVIEETGVAAAVLNHPAQGIAWLANKLAPHDIGLEAGQTVMGGSFTRVVDARRGDIFNVDYGPLGVVTCSFI